MPDAAFTFDVLEGDTLSLPWELPNIPGMQMSITWTFTDGTAVAGEDYFAFATVVNLSPGQIYNIDISTLTDSVIDPGESFTVSITSTTTYLGLTTYFNELVTINIIDGPPSETNAATGLTDAFGFDPSDSGSESLGDHESFETPEYHFDPVTKLWSAIKNGVTIFLASTQSTVQAIYDYFADETVAATEEFVEDYVTEHVPASKVAFDAWRISEPAVSFYVSTKTFYDKTWTRLDQAFLDADPTDPNLNASFDVAAVEADLKQYARENIDRIIALPVNGGLDAAEKVMNSVRIWFQHSDLSARLDIDANVDGTTAGLTARAGHNNIVAGSAGVDIFAGGLLGDVMYGASGNDQINGGGGSDVLMGGIGKDILLGGAGNDILSGGVGNDLLIGGTGNDKFVFANGFGTDTTRGFSSSNLEVIDLSDVVAITSFRDLLINHLQTDTATGFAEIVVGSNTILLHGILASDIGVGRAYSAGDFVF